jgi:hypothetical protein
MGNSFESRRTEEIFDGGRDFMGCRADDDDDISIFRFTGI